MERTKQQRATYRVQHIPIEEMFTSQELTDLKHAFELESKGDAFINLDSLSAIFAGM
jgi:Ca2+-binding EF-hand superfamily protein